mgnify:FL=1
MLTSLWVLLAFSMQSPRFLHSMMVNIPHCDSQQASQLLTKLQAIMGVEEAVILAQEGVVYLKVDKNRLNEQDLQQALSY